MKSLFPAPLMAVFMAAACLHAETVTLAPVQDTDLYAFTKLPTSSLYSLGVTSYHGTTPAELGAHSQRSMIQFSFAGLGIPASEIGSATLRLYLVEAAAIGGGLSGGNLSVFRQSRAWSVTASPTVRWSDLSPAEQVGSIAVVNPVADTWIEIDVTDVVRRWVDNSVPNYGLILQPETESITPYMNLAFGSMKLNETSAKVGPQLVVTRGVVAPAAPPVLAVTALPETGEVRVTWPVSGSTGWTLETASSPGGPWAASAAAVTSVAGQNQTTVPAPEGAGFFRLSKP